MDRQAIYNKVRAHLLSMDAQAGIQEPGCHFSCKYLDHEGRRCAIGVLIPDDQTEALLCSGDVVELLEQFPDLAELWDVSFDDTDDTDFLMVLQAIHDEGGHWDGNEGGLNSDGVTRLDDFAHKHDLSIEGG